MNNPMWIRMAVEVIPIFCSYVFGLYFCFVEKVDEERKISSQIWIRMAYKSYIYIYIYRYVIVLYFVCS